MSLSSSSTAQAAPALTQAEAVQLYRTLLLARRTEELIGREYDRDEMKTPVHLGIGEEAIPIGVWHAVPAGSTAFGTYRNHALYLAVTGETDALFGELYGKATGPGKGKAGSMHVASPEHGLIATSAVVATTIPLAVGAALAHAYRGAPNLVAVFFGDGAVEEGAFWESLNFACLRGLRILFVCEDNHLAIHTPSSQRQGFRSLPDAVQGFRCSVGSCDGSDLPGVIAAARQLMDRMEQTGQPGLLHATYLRRLEHVGPREDFQAGYRAQPSPEQLRQLDPVARFERVLADLGCPPEALEEMAAGVDAQLARSLQLAREAPFPAADELHTDAWA